MGGARRDRTVRNDVRRAVRPAAGRGPAARPGEGAGDTRRSVASEPSRGHNRPIRGLNWTGGVMNVMEAHGLRKTYEAEGAPVRALRGVDMVIEQGEFVA